MHKKILTLSLYVITCKTFAENNYDIIKNKKTFSYLINYDLIKKEEELCQNKNSLKNNIDNEEDNQKFKDQKVNLKNTIKLENLKLNKTVFFIFKNLILNFPFKNGKFNNIFEIYFENSNTKEEQYIKLTNKWITLYKNQKILIDSVLKKQKLLQNKHILYYN
jgi:hypothetical protein